MVICSNSGPFLATKLANLSMMVLISGSIVKGHVTYTAVNVLPSGGGGGLTLVIAAILLHVEWVCLSGMGVAALKI